MMKITAPVEALRSRPFLPDEEKHERDRQQGNHEEWLAKALEDGVHGRLRTRGEGGLFPGFPLASVARLL